MRDARDDFHALAIFAHLSRASVHELIALYDARRYRQRYSRENNYTR